MSYGVDGFSLALDFKVTDRNRARLESMFREFDRIVLEANGRFYLAKNSDTPREAIARSMGAESMATIRRMRDAVDPERVLMGDLARRAFPR